MKFCTLILIFASVASGQSIEIENDGQEATGFLTVHGLFTSDHVDRQQATVRFQKRDVRVDERQKSKHGFKFGSGRPSFFYDRRNHKVPVIVIETGKHFYTVDVRFYPGESGTPVFDRFRRVVGVVSGNRRNTDAPYQWMGRVSIFGKSESDSYFQRNAAK